MQKFIFFIPLIWIISIYSNFGYLWFNDKFLFVIFNEQITMGLVLITTIIILTIGYNEKMKYNI